METLAKETQTERESKTLETGKIYLRGNLEVADPQKAESQYVFDWTEEVNNLDIPIGELRRLSTCYQKGEKKEQIGHRVLLLDANDYLQEKLNNKIESTSGDVAVTTRTKPRKTTRLKRILQEQLERIRENKDKPPIIVIPDFSSGPLMKQAWPLTATGRKVVALSYPEYMLSDCSESSINKWSDAADYVPFYKEVLTQLGVNNFDAVGWSAGAAIVAALAANPETKEKVNKLVLHNPGGVFPQPGIGIAKIFNEVRWWQTESAKTIEAKRKFFDPVAPPPLKSEKNINQRRLPMGLPLLTDAKRGVQIVSSRPIIDKLEGLQVLVIGSSEDKVFPPRRLKKEVKGKKGFTFMEALGRGHSGIGTDELIGTKIIDWLDQ